MNKFKVLTSDWPDIFPVGSIVEPYNGRNGGYIVSGPNNDKPKEGRFSISSYFFNEEDLELVGQDQPTASATTFVGHPDGALGRVVEAGESLAKSINDLIPVSHKDYMSLSDAYDKHSRDLMSLKGEEYAIDGDFLAMENRLAGMLGDTPEYVSLVMAGKHITALGIILLKNDPEEIKLAKLDERVRDATNLLKIMATFIHAKQNDFSLHLGKDETDRTEPVDGVY